MHLPDSAISPATSLLTGAAMLPAWVYASRKTYGSATRRQAPIVSIGAAFCFTVMLFNLPLPGGTSVHPLGAGLASALLGPWGAMISMSLALTVQALFFGDGGILALGANCLAMAAVMPSISYAVYRLVAGNSAEDAPRRAFAAAIGAYFGISAAALVVSVLLGIQPWLYHDSAGHALYFPFGLSVTIPAMMIPHLTLAGFAEAGVTFTAVRFLQRAGFALAGVKPKRSVAATPTRLAWAGMAACLALAPFGLLAAGGAWGEWSLEEIEERTSYRPVQLATMEQNGWKGLQLLPDYLSDKGPAAYCFSALAGVGILGFAGSGLNRFGRRNLKGLTVTASNRSSAAPALRSVPGSSATIPHWLAQSEKDHPVNKRIVRERFASRTLIAISNAVLMTLRSDDTAKQHGLWQILDTRVRIVSTLALIICASCIHLPLLVSALYLLTLALGIASKIPFRFLLGRVWLGAPLLMAGIVIPTLFESVTPGRVLLTISSHPHLAVSAPGVVSAAILLLRTATTITAALVLISTTYKSALFAGLRALLLPKSLTDSLALTYRHLGTLANTASEMFVARRARDLGKQRNTDRHRDAGNLLGGLFLKAEAVAHEVDLAVEARTISSRTRTLTKWQLRSYDYIWIGSLILTITLFIWGDRHGWH